MNANCSLCLVFLAILVPFSAEAEVFRITDGGSGGKLLISGRDTIGTFLAFESESIDASDKIREIEPGVFKWQRRFRAGDQLSTGHARLLMDFEANYRSRYMMIPSVSYNGNRWKNSFEPRGFIAEDGSPWSFAYHRASVPGATYSEAGNRCVSLFGQMGPYGNGFSCSLIPGTDATLHRLIWPEEEQPLVYISKRRPYLKGYSDTLKWGDDMTLTTTAYLVIGEKPARGTGYQKMLDFAWRLNYHKVSPWYSPKELWELGIEFLTQRLWTEEKAMFQVGFRYDGKDSYLNVGGFQIGWAGANGSVSISLIYDYLKHGRKESLEMALRCLDAWMLKQLDTGLLDVASEVDWIKFQDVANQAQGAESYMEAYILLKENGIHKPAYKQTALDVCDFMLSVQESSGRYGKAWDNYSKPVEQDGSIGSFMVRPMVMAFELTGERKYLESAVRGMEFYYDEFMDQGYATAGAIDIYTIDKEGAVGILEGSIRLFEHTGNRDYLHKARQAAYYLSTWQYHHSVLFRNGSPLEDLGFDTFGGTSVATAHAVMDPYAVKYIPELLKLSDYYQEPIWTQRALAIWNNSTVGISDGTLSVMELPPIPKGAQSETYFQTNWGTILPNRYVPGTFNYEDPQGLMSNWFVIWPTAYRLEVIRKIGINQITSMEGMRPFVK